MNIFNGLAACEVGFRQLELKYHCINLAAHWEWIKYIEQYLLKGTSIILWIQRNAKSLYTCYKSSIAFGQKFQEGFLIDICFVCVVSRKHNDGWLSDIGFASGAGGRGSNPDKQEIKVPLPNTSLQNSQFGLPQKHMSHFSVRRSRKFDSFK